MVDRVSSGVGSLSAIRDALKATGQFGPAPITPEMETYAQTYRDFLGTPDYASRDKEATDLAKLQMFLAMAQRGFAGAGEAQRPGEHAVSTFFRTVGAPLAQDLSPIAGRLMQQRQATKAAREQEERAIKLAALTAGTTARDRLTDAALKLIPDPSTDKGASSLEKNVFFNYKDQEVLGNVHVYRSKQGDQQVIRTVGKHTYEDAEGEKKVIPAGALVTGFRKPLSDGKDKNYFTRGYAKQLGRDKKPKGSVFPISGQYKDGKFTYTGPTEVGDIILTGDNRNAVLVDATGEPFAPAAGTTKPTITKLGHVREWVRDEDGELVLSPNLFQALQETVGEKTTTIRADTGDAITIGRGLREFEIVDPKETAAGKLTFSGKYVVVDEDRKAVEENGRHIQLMRGSDGKYYIAGNPEKGPYAAKKDHDIIETQYFDFGTGAVKLAAPNQTEIARNNLVEGVRNQLAAYQSILGGGRGMPVTNKPNVLYWNQGEFIKGNSPYYITGANPSDRSQDRAITDEKALKFLRERTRSIAISVLKGHGEIVPAMHTIKSDQIKTAAKKILAPNLDVVLGNAFPDTYQPPSPLELTESRTKQRILEGEAVDILKDPLAAPNVALGPVSRPGDEKAFFKPIKQVKIATELFPSLYKTPTQPRTKGYYTEDVQQRKDQEVGLFTAGLSVSDSPEVLREKINAAATKVADERQKWQFRKSAGEVQKEVNERLDFRAALLNFRNALLESEDAAGWISGRITKAMVKLGWEGFLKKDPAIAEAYRELRFASNRFEAGFSRKMGHEFGDERIGVYDVEDYKKLVANIVESPEYNRTIIDNGLRMINSDLTNWMALGGRVGFDERTLERVAKSGVDFSKLKTTENWHGYGYYGKNRYRATKQPQRTLTDSQRLELRTEGKLEDSKYRGRFVVPLVNWGDPNDTGGFKSPSFSRTEGSETTTQVMDDYMFDALVKGVAVKVYGTTDPTAEQLRKIRKHITDGIVSYSGWRKGG